MPSSTSSSSSSRLNRLGYERYELASTLGVSPRDERFERLLTEFTQLPPDPYSRDEGRYRRFGRGIIFPWNDEFHWMPPTIPDRPNDTSAVNAYQQGKHNPQFVGRVRYVPALTAAVQENPLLTELIRFDFAQTRWSEAELGWPFLVGVHMLKLSVDDPTGRAVATPDMLHQDGEPYTFAHLVHRRDADGGDNVIAAPEHAGRLPKDITADGTLARFVLRRPLDSYGVKDDLVSHYVGPITVAAGAENAERAVLLIDFSPMTQWLPQ